MKRLGNMLAILGVMTMLAGCDGLWVTSGVGSYYDNDPYYNSPVCYNTPCYWFPTYSPSVPPPRRPWGGGAWNNPHPVYRPGIGNGPQHWIPPMGTGVNVGSQAGQRPVAVIRH